MVLCHVCYFSPVATTGAATIPLSTPLTVEMGDCIGMFFYGLAIDYTWQSSQMIKYNWRQQAMGVGGSINFSSTTRRAYSYAVSFSPIACALPPAVSYGFNGVFLGQSATMVDVVLASASQQMTTPAFTVQRSTDTPLVDTVDYSLSLTATATSTSFDAANLSFGGSLNVTCGDVVQVSVWVKLLTALPTGAMTSLGCSVVALNGTVVNPVVLSLTAFAPVGTWQFVPYQYTASVSGAVTILCLLPHVSLRLTDFAVTKLYQESEVNLGLESTRTDVTPPGFIVAGHHQSVNLTQPVTFNEGLHGTVASGYSTSVYSDDIPAAASDPRSIQFHVNQSGPFLYYGYRLQVRTSTRATPGLCQRQFA